MSIIEDTRSQWAAKSNEDISVSSTDVDCNNKQRAASSWVKHPDDGKNNVTYVSVVSNNVASLHWLLPLNKSPFCPSAFHKERRSTSCRRLEKHHCSIVELAGHAPDRLVGWLCFFRWQHPNWEGNEWLDLRWLEHRSCFFLLQKGVQLVQFCHFGFLWHRRRRQFRDIDTDPIRDTLRTDFQDAGNWPVTTTFHIHTKCQHAGFLRVTFLSGHRRICSFTLPTLISLAPRMVEPSFHLPPIRSTTWTFHSAILLPILDTPVYRGMVFKTVWFDYNFCHERTC